MPGLWWLLLLLLLLFVLLPLTGAWADSRRIWVRSPATGFEGGRGMQLLADFVWLGILLGLFFVFARVFGSGPAGQ